MRIFVDNEYKCNTGYSEGFREFDVPFFDGKCREFVEGYRYVPEFEVWINNGNVYKGEMISPVDSIDMLERFQACADTVEEKNLDEIANLIDLLFEADLDFIFGEEN